MGLDHGVEKFLFSIMGLSTSSGQFLIFPIGHLPESPHSPPLALPWPSSLASQQGGRGGLSSLPLLGSGDWQSSGQLSQRLDSEAQWLAARSGSGPGGFLLWARRVISSVCRVGQQDLGGFAACIPTGSSGQRPCGSLLLRGAFSEWSSFL